MSFILSPNMSLPVPVVGVEPGPQYALDINNSLSLVDSHDHSLGKGIQVTPNGLNINSDLPFTNNNITTLRSARYTVQPSVLSLGTDIGATYVTGVDLYYNDINGNQVRLTQNGGVAGTPGSISNLVPPANAAYNASNQTFIFQSAANTSANLDASSVIFRDLVANSNGITLSAPSSLSSNYTITLPSSTPSTVTPVTMDSSGNLGTSQITLAMLSAIVAQALNPTGTILAYGGSNTSIPSGYFLCDGSLYSRTTYAQLFTAIGSNYGNGDGTSTFAVPDLRGIFLRGTDLGRGADPDTASRGSSATQGGSSNAGDAVGSFQSNAFEVHNHPVTVSDPGHHHTMSSFQAGSTTISGANTQVVSSPVNTGTATSTTTTTVGTGITAVTANEGQSNGETRPVNVYVNYIIKY